MKEFFDAIKSNLFIAAHDGHTEIVQLLLDRAANVNQANNNGWTPLLIAAEKGHTEVARLLLERGANVNQANNNGWTPLLIAIHHDHAELARLLLDHDADVNQAAYGGTTALILAAYNGHAEFTRLLLAAPGIQVNQANNNGYAPLYAASQKGHAEIAHLLLECGADVSQVANNGWTPLSTTARKGHAEVARLLLAAPGIQVNQANNNGYTPLGVASRYRNNNIVALLNACSVDGKQRKRAFRAVDLSGKKAVICYYINMNQHLIATALFKSLKPKDRIKLIGVIAPGVNKQYRNLRNFSLVCKKFFNAAALNKANMYHARDGFSLFQYKKFNDEENSSAKLPEDVLYHMSQFLFFASKDQEKQIRMIERSRCWHNEARTGLTPGYESEPYSCCIV
mgnify:CR=1 FL=1